MNRSVLFILAVLLLTGCIPRYATVRPPVDSKIVDTQGRGIPKAEVWIQTLQNVPGGHRPAEKFTTNADGVIVVERARQWSPIVFFLHGAVFYHWRWCIDAEGYEPVEGSESIPSVVVLQNASAGRDCSDYVTGQD